MSPWTQALIRILQPNPAGPEAEGCEAIIFGAYTLVILGIGFALGKFL